MKKILLLGVFALLAVCQQTVLGQDRSMYDFPTSAPTYNMRSNTTAASKSASVACFTTTSASYATDISPQGMSSGDLDNDGDIDLVTANAGANTVSVFLNQGTGTFASKVDYAAANSSFSVTIADLNKDGFKDIVAVGSTGNVKVLLNSGTATFTVGTSWTFMGSNAAKVGDLNADGNPDLVVSTSSTVTVLLGNGDGTFATGVAYATGNNPVEIALRDFDADGDLDIAVANYVSGSISVLLGTGTGTFGTHVTYTTNTQPQGLVSGDFDGDGDYDLAANNFGSSNVSVLLGNGNGTFATKVDYTVGTAPRFIAMGDVNADGKLDLAITNRDSNSFSLLLGNGNGTFASDCQVGLGTSPRPITIADFNSDGVADIATGQFNANTLIVNLSDPKIVATTTAATAITATGATLNGTINPNGLAVGSASFRISSIYSTLSTYSSISVNVSSIGTGTTAVPFTSAQTGLSPNTTYYYQMVACEPAPLNGALGRAVQGGINLKTRDGSKSLSGGGLTCYTGAIMSFTTLPAPTIAVTTTAATSVMATSATLNGTINPNGLGVSSATFRYGTSPTLATFSTATVNISGIGSGTSPVPFSTPITGLTGSTTYYFQLTALRGALGKTETPSPTVNGDILSFTTPAQFRPPVFTIPDVAAGEDGKPFDLELKAEDPDGDPITYRIVSGPDWLVLTEEGGVFRLKGRSGQQHVGANVVKIEATSGSGAGLFKTEFTLTITISNVDYPPVFSSLNTAAGEDCKPFYHIVKATDLDGEGIDYKIVSGPSWLMLKEEANGVFSLQGAPGQSETGVHTVKISATSGSGAGLMTAEQTLTITIADVAHPPVFSNSGLWGVVTQTGSAYSQSFTVNDCDGGSLRLYSEDLPSWINFGTAIPGLNSLTQSISGTTHTVGHYLFSLIASDGVSNAVLPLSVYVKPYYIPVVSSIPATTFANQTVSYPIEVVAEDGDPFTVSVANAPAGLSLVCNDTPSTSGMCKGSDRAELKGTVNPASLPAWVKIRVSDEVTVNAQASCQEFELVMDGSTLTARNAQKTKCDGTPLVPTIQKRIATATEEEIPSSFALTSVYPNPFNPSTQISFSVPVTSPVRLEVFDLNGRVVATPFNQTVSAGSYTVSFQAHGLASGMYFVRMMAQDKVFSKQMVLMK
ncbi:MAG: T9SS type A sorting domain-containing protein [Rhodothermia bacterium]|nr:T9SS type A sorting domain-containing protein [Rhodothermia bacterium]